MAEKKYLVDLNVDGDILSSGDVGLGITPDERLHISGEPHPAIKVQSSSDSTYNYQINCGYRDESFSLVVGGYKVLTTEGYNTPEKTFIYANNAKALSFASDGEATFSSDVIADSYTKAGGTSSQYLMADGSSKEQTAIYSVASLSAMVALTTKQGDIVVRTDESKTYMDNGGELLGSEILSYGDFSSIAYPWNYGSWSYIPNPSVSGGIATLTISGGSYPSVNPRIEQSFLTVQGEEYVIEVTGDGQGNDIQVLAVDPNNGFAFIKAFDIIANGSYVTNSMTVTAPSGDIVIQILVKGSNGDVAYLSNASAKLVDPTAKYTHFASI